MACINEQKKVVIAQHFDQMFKFHFIEFVIGTFSFDKTTNS